MRSILSKLCHGFLAGLLIAVGGSVFLFCLSEQTASGQVLSKYVGAFFFSVALVCICMKGYSLYTGRIGFIPEDHSREAFASLFLGLLGNIIATVLLGFACRYAVSQLAAPAESICTAKLTQSAGQTFIRGCMCGVLMYLAVSIWKEHKRIAGILFCVPAFILAGFEHSIANMFYFAAADMLSLRAVGYLALVVAGNTVGAMVPPLLSSVGKVGTKK